MFPPFLKPGALALGLSIHCLATTAAAEPARYEAKNLSELTGLDKLGIDADVWGWGFYTFTDQDSYNTAWGAELEFDFTRTFANRISLSADAEFIDDNDRVYGNFEQLFASLLVSHDAGIVLTVGKFNSPFGAEGRDFWDRYTATPSLLFQSQPQDLRGAMLTTPLGDTNVKLRSYVVTAFGENGAIAGRPSWAVTAEYRPNERIMLSATGWMGPGIKLAHYHEYGYGTSDADDQARQNQNYELTSGWWSAEYDSVRKGVLYFFDAYAIVKPRADLTLVGEFLYGTENVNYRANYWMGLMALANFDIDDHLRIFGMWSWIDDSDWVIWPELQRRNQVSAGLGYRVNQYWEVRAEYRHDFSDAIDDMDSLSFHVVFGY